MWRITPSASISKDSIHYSFRISFCFFASLAGSIARSVDRFLCRFRGVVPKAKHIPRAVEQLIWSLAPCSDSAQSKSGLTFPCGHESEPGREGGGVCIHRSSMLLARQARQARLIEPSACSDRCSQWLGSNPLKVSVLERFGIHPLHNKNLQDIYGILHLE